MTVTPVAFPDPPLRNSWGYHEPWALRTIVQLFTDDGLVGLGEMAGGGFVVPCRQLLALGGVNTAVIGPLLEDEAARVHSGFWQ